MTVWYEIRYNNVKLPDPWLLMKFNPTPRYVQMNQPPISAGSNKKRPATEFHRANSRR